jgi:hypothetical protein
VPASNASRPLRTASRGETFGNRRGMPIAAARSVIESGSSRAPVSSADRPRQTDRNSGTTKKKPAWTRYWKKNMVSPPVSCLFRSIAGRTSGSSPFASSWASQRKKIQSTNRPARISQTVGDSPAHEGPPAFGCIQPHSPARSTPKTESPRPRADSTAPTTSSRGRFSTGASAMRRASSRMTRTSTTSPANTHRQEK